MSIAVITVEGQTLIYNKEDVEDLEISLPADVITNEDGSRELGTHHLYLHVTFKEGKQAKWIQTD